MTCMIEQVAIAIGEAYVAKCGGPDPVRRAVSLDVLARAAIEAMRPPTERMLTDAGPMTGWDGPSHKCDENHIEWYNSIIDAALEPPQ